MRGQTKSPYEILGVSTNASAKEIQSAYRKLAQQYHPDVNPDNPEAEAKFKEIGAAYAILGDSDKRKEFDQGIIDANGDPIYSHNHGPWSNENHFGFMDGFGFQFNQPQVKNPSVTVHYEVDASNLFSEHEAQIKYQRVSACRDCSGNGGNGNSSICHDCRGTGNRIQVKNIGHIMMQELSTCRTCSGRGKIFDTNCKSCDGIGLKTSNEEVTLKMPANCAYGSMMINERGHQETLSAPAGNLVIVVIPKSKHCKFDGYTAHYELLIDPIRAMLGCRVKANGLKPKEELLIDIPKMTEPNTNVVIKHKGLCDMNGKRHDANIKIVYKMPESLSENQEAALNAYLTVNDNMQES